MRRKWGAHHVLFKTAIMHYENTEWTVAQLLELHKSNNLNLRPTYQRNDIWSLPAKKRLVESIRLGYPLPSFFLHKTTENKYDMVDGQQRTRTLIGFTQNIFPDLNKKPFDAVKDKDLLDFKISVTIIETHSEGEIEDFYYRVNKFGTKLNVQETLKAQHSDSLFLSLIEELAASEEFSNLGIFSGTHLSRMIDVDFTSELVAQLKYGITDKKKYAEKLYSDLATQEENTLLRNEFYEIIRIFQKLDKVFPVKATRYRQKNDFYTLFGLFNNIKELSNETLEYFYKILVIIDEGITPSNIKCPALQKYAINCVSQSNSIDARRARLGFFEQLLLNEGNELNSTQKEVLSYFKSEGAYKEVDEYLTLDADVVNRNLSEPIKF
jgi:hypothetical protein